MRFIDFVHAFALVVLLGWLVVGSVIDAEHPGESLAQNTAASPSVDSAPPRQLQPIATATVGERKFRIFVGRSPDLYSVAVSEND